MKIDRVNKVLDVAEAIGFLLDRLNFVAQPLGRGIRRAQFEITDDTIQPLVEHPGHLDHQLKPAMRGPEIPLLCFLRFFAMVPVLSRSCLTDRKPMGYPNLTSDTKFRHRL